MFLNIEHNIRFDYDDYISESWVELRIEPLTNFLQTVHSFFLAVGPRAKVQRYEDWCGNSVRHFSIAEYHNVIEVRAKSLVETRPAPVLLAALDGPASNGDSHGALHDFLTFDGPITNSPALRSEFRKVGVKASMTLGEQVGLIGDYIHREFKYMPNVTTYESTIDEALNHRAGVCQDLAQLMIGMLRLAGIPARYVNGYVFVPRHRSDVAESHAWIEFFSPSAGWVAYDPTHGLQPGEDHVVVATGRHYDDVPPNRGVYRGTAKEKLTAYVHIDRVDAPEFKHFREEIREIELPVYAEFPGRMLLGTIEEQVDQLSQQQQQQQQQQ